MTARKLPFLTKFYWGVGQMGEGVKNAAFNSFLLFYYNQILGVSAALTGLALGIAVLCDAISDPLAGSVSDRFESRWGRRHPFMAASAIPLGITLFLLFSPPEGQSEMFYFGWVLFFAVAVRTFLTLYHIPHLALGAEMAKDYVDRTTLFSFGSFFGTVGGYAFGFMMLTFYFPSRPDLPHGLYNAAGYTTMAAWAGVIAVITILACTWGTRKEIPFLAKTVKAATPLGPTRLYNELKVAFSSPSYRSIFLGLMLGTVVVSIEGTLGQFMGAHFWELETEQLRWIPIAVLIGIPFGVMLAAPLTRIWDKKQCLIIPAAVSIVMGNVLIVLRLLDLLPPNGDPIILPLILGASFSAAVTIPVIFITINSMFADISDELEYITGERQEGIIYAARAFAGKAAAAMGTIFGGFVLQMINFPKQAPPGTVDEDVIFYLGLSQGPLTSIFTFCGLLLYMRYRLTRQRHAEIVAELEVRRAARGEDSDTADAGTVPAPAGR